VSLRRVRSTIARLRRSADCAPETRAQLRIIEQALMDAPTLVRRVMPEARVPRIMTPEQLEDTLYAILAEALASQLVATIRDDRSRRNRV
jgi:hypothetical protein